MPQTQISQTSFQPTLIGLGDAPFIRFWYSQNFIASDGVTPVIAGNGQTSFFKDVVCSIVDNRLVMPATDLWATTTGTPATSLFFGQLYSEEGAPRDMLFGGSPAASGWQLPTVYGAVITYGELATYNRAAYLLSAPSTYFTADQTIAEIRRLAGDFMYAAVGVNGITALSVAPVSAADPVAEGTNSARIPNIFNVKGAPYYAVGDGVADDTAAIQAAITAAISSTKGATVYLPPGTFKVTSTLAISGVRGIHFVGSGNQSVLLWGGNASLPLITLGSVANSVVSDFMVQASAAVPLAEAIRIENSGVGSVAPMFNRFSNIWIDGTTSGVGIGFRGKLGAGGNANNDFMLFENCHVLNYSHSGWTIEANQMHGWNFLNCHAVGAAGIGKHAVSGGGSNGTLSNFFWNGGFVGNNTEGDFYVGVMASVSLATEIANISSEGSARFLKDGPLGSVSRITARNIRWSGDQIHADGIAVELHCAGPYDFQNCTFQGGVSDSVKIFWETSQSPFEPSFIFNNCTILGSETTVAGAFTGRVPTSMQGSSLADPSTGATTLRLNTLSINAGNKASGGFQVLNELVTIAAAATTDTTIQLPAGAIVMSVSVLVTVAMPTATAFTVTGATTATVFNTAAVLNGVNQSNPGTAAGAYYNAAAQAIRITPDLTPAANTGRVRVAVVYYQSAPPAP